MTVLTVLFAILLILGAVTLIGMGYNYLFSGDFFGWIFFGHNMVEAGGAIIQFAIELIASVCNPE